MTERLYYDQQTLMHFDATVTACEAVENGYSVKLDRSAFYPTSGGQPFDKGTLNDANILDVYVEDGDVVHIVDKPLNVGETVQGDIDWDRRFDHMQQHAADHMIAGAIHRKLQGVTIGLHIGDNVSSIDVAMPNGETRLSAEVIRDLEWDVNEHIQRDVPIRCWFPSVEELETLPLRKKPTVSEHVRIVAIGDDEMVACGGTHPETAGRIGLVKIISATPARGKVRVAFVAGRRALSYLFECADAAVSASNKLSTGIENLPEAVDNRIEQIRELMGEVSALREARVHDGMAAMIADAEVLGNGMRLVTALMDEPVQSVQKLVSSLIEDETMIALIGAGSDDNYSFVFGSGNPKLASAGDLLKKAAQATGGKGGGRPDYAQGRGSAELLKTAVDLLKEC
ncbi:MAG: DHHA1 domain-containing protein [Clostridia bacterium]|nr:DHHA1 domain-containing protein [Clostridia bacterium]